MIGSSRNPIFSANPSDNTPALSVLNDKKILVTGANGFIGKALVARLANSNRAVKACIRRSSSNPFNSSRIETVYLPQIDRFTNWLPHLRNVSCVIHLAAKVHSPHGTIGGQYGQYEEVNYRATEALMTACQLAKINRFIYLSSVKVHGEGRDWAYREEDVLCPHDAYAKTKQLAEDAVKLEGAKGDTEWVILRSPLVYGPGVKANFLALMRLVGWRLPLPLASLTNRRSMIYVQNLVDALFYTIDNPNAVGQVFLVSDDFDLTVPELITELAQSMGRSPKLFPFPPQVLEHLFCLTGRGKIIQKLTRPFTVDISKIKTQTGWRPPIRVNDGIAETVKWYKKHSN